MSNEAGQIEQPAPDSSTESKELPIRYATAITGFASLVLGCFVVGILVAQMFDEDQIRLHVLDTLVKILQAIARLAGGWAIECENAYNQYVNVLH